MLRPRIKILGQIPYGGEYKLNLPELGFVGSGYTFERLVINIRKWREANGLPNGLDLENEIEREICKKYPDECHETDSRIPKRVRASFQTVIQGTELMVKHWWGGRKLVDQGEANRRAAICGGCPNNFDVSLPCGNNCAGLLELVNNIIGSKSTPSQGLLKQCAICHCYNEAAVWVDLDTQWSVLTDEQKLQFKTAQEQVGCWKCPETASSPTPQEESGPVVPG